MEKVSEPWTRGRADGPGTTSPFSFRIRRLNSFPSRHRKSSPGWMMPHLAAMARAVLMLSPVTMRTVMPARWHLRIASGTWKGQDGWSPDPLLHPDLEEAGETACQLCPGWEPGPQGAGCPQAQVPPSLCRPRGLPTTQNQALTPRARLGEATGTLSRGTIGAVCSKVTGEITQLFQPQFPLGKWRPRAAEPGPVPLAGQLAGAVPVSSGRTRKEPLAPAAPPAGRTHLGLDPLGP